MADLQMLVTWGKEDMDVKSPTKVLTSHRGGTRSEPIGMVVDVPIFRGLLENSNISALSSFSLRLFVS